MEEHLQTSTTTTPCPYNDDIIIDSTCSTPYVSAPSSPGRSTCNNNNSYSCYYYSAPASPMHYLLSSSSISPTQQIPFPSDKSSTSPSPSPFDNFFDFSDSTSSGPITMTSADELFSNGKIRPIKLSTHLQRPQILAPLIDADEDEQFDNSRGRDIKLRSKSLRRTRSMSPFRTTASFDWQENENENENEIEIEDEEIVVEEKEEEEKEEKENETTPCGSGNSSRSSSVGRSSKRWVLLKEFLYRSKSEGRNNGSNKFWNNLSFSPVVKEKKLEKVKIGKNKGNNNNNNNGGLEEIMKKKRVNGVMGKRRMGIPSAHEIHYTANRAQAEEMRKKTFLPYRQGLLGCLGFSSRSYGAWNGFARAFNPVSST